MTPRQRHLVTVALFGLLALAHFYLFAWLLIEGSYWWATFCLACLYYATWRFATVVVRDVRWWGRS